MRLLFPLLLALTAGCASPSALVQHGRQGTKPPQPRFSIRGIGVDMPWAAARQQLGRPLREVRLPKVGPDGTRAWAEWSDVQVWEVEQGLEIRGPELQRDGAVIGRQASVLADLPVGPFTLVCGEYCATLPDGNTLRVEPRPLTLGPRRAYAYTLSPRGAPASPLPPRSRSSSAAPSSGAGGPYPGSPARRGSKP